MCMQNIGIENTIIPSKANIPNDRFTTKFPKSLLAGSKQDLHGPQRFFKDEGG